MELNAVNWLMLVLERHDQTMFRLARRDYKIAGKAFLRGDQRVIAHSFEALRQSLKDLGRMFDFDLACFAVHYLRCAHDLAAEMMDDALMPEADAENMCLQL